MQEKQAGWGILKAASSGLEAVSIGAITLLAVLVFAQILLRNIFSIAFSWMDELTRYLQVSIIFLMVPVLARRGQHLFVDGLVMTFPAGIRKVLETFSLIAMVLFAAGFLVSGYALMLKAGSVKTPAMGMSNYIFFLPAFIGMALFILSSLERLASLWGGKK